MISSLGGLTISDIRFFCFFSYGFQAVFSARQVRARRTPRSPTFQWPSTAADRLIMFSERYYFINFSVAVAMSCKVTFSFVKGPCLGQEIVHEFDGQATVFDMKKFLTETHHACADSQFLDFVWVEQQKIMNDDGQKVFSLGQNASITVNLKKRDAEDTFPSYGDLICLQREDDSTSTLLRKRATYSRYVFSRVIVSLTISLTPDQRYI